LQKKNTEDLLQQTTSVLNKHGKAMKIINSLKEPALRELRDGEEKENSSKVETKTGACLQMEGSNQCVSELVAGRSEERGMREMERG